MKEIQSWPRLHPISRSPTGWLWSDPVAEECSSLPSFPRPHQTPLHQTFEWSFIGFTRPFAYIDDDDEPYNTCMIRTRTSPKPVRPLPWMLSGGTSTSGTSAHVPTTLPTSASSLCLQTSLLASPSLPLEPHWVWLMQPLQNSRTPPCWDENTGTTGVPRRPYLYRYRFNQPEDPSLCLYL